MRVETQYLAAEIEALERDIQELKNKQLLGGSSVLGYLTKSNNLNDYSILLDTGTGMTKKYRITFTHDHSLHGSIQQLFLFYAIDNTDVMGHYVPPWGSGVITGTVQKEQPTDTQSTWYLSITNTDGTLAPHTAYLKLFFSGTDSGSWNIVQI